MQDDQTFDDQVVEYFIILVRKQDILAYSGRENPKICIITQNRSKGRNHLPRLLVGISNATAHYNFPLLAMHITQDGGQ